MECQLIDDKLVYFHFGELPHSERRQCEHHLSVCMKCLAAYFEIKRNIELPSTPDELPLKKPILRRRVLIPSAMVATAAFLLVFTFSVLQNAQTKHHEPNEDVQFTSAEIDSANQTAVSLNLL